MGAEQFFTKAEGKNAQEAFKLAVSQAQYDHGHSGYTGTIAEKNEFVMIPLPEGREAEPYADELMNTLDERIDSKWGPAGCFEVAPGQYAFFGWASS